MKKVLIATGLATALFASPFEITPTIGAGFPEHNLDLKNQLNAGLRIGYNFNYLLLDKIEIGAEFTNAEYKSVKGSAEEKTKIGRYFVNAIKEFDLSQKFALYGLAGVGYEDIRKELYENDDSGFGQYGFGVRYALNEALSLRLEARHAIKFDHGDNNFFTTLGFTYRFGTQSSDEAVVEEESQPQQAVVVEEKKSQPAPVVYGDSDNDGVTDDKDLCPNTPAGEIVDAVGCVKVISLKMVNFGFGKSEITSSFDEEIQKVAAVLNSESDYKVRIEGHTDSTGPATYNMKLSEERAKAVSNRLVELGVDESRIMTEWFGETRPIADNSTPEGRAENRRVDTSFAK